MTPPGRIDANLARQSARAAVPEPTPDAWPLWGTCEAVRDVAARAARGWPTECSGDDLAVQRGDLSRLVGLEPCS